VWIEVDSDLRESRHGVEELVTHFFRDRVGIAERRILVHEYVELGP
jgi:hypothetical protein